jgi:hypothetical protein
MIKIKTGILLDWDQYEIILDNGEETYLYWMLDAGWEVKFAPLGPGESGMCRVVFLAQTPQIRDVTAATVRHGTLDIDDTEFALCANLAVMGEN